MTVFEMLQKMPSSEITYWRKLYEMESDEAKAKGLENRANTNRRKAKKMMGGR